MKRIFGIALLLTGTLVLSAGISLAGASSKFAYTEQVTAARSLIVDFEEGSLKRFASVDYELAATARAQYCDGGVEAQALVDTDTLLPDDKGRVSGSLTLQPGVSPGHVCAPSYIEFTSVTLTNLSTGHVYRLDSASRDFSS
jgi:hypothetical protein